MDNKPFDLEAAKAGAPVCTVEGKPARIICFDKKGGSYPIVALVSFSPDKERLLPYTSTGSYNVGGYAPQLDLRMVPVKKSGWINLYKDPDDEGLCPGNNIFTDKERAERTGHTSDIYRHTIEIHWEE